MESRVVGFEVWTARTGADHAAGVLLRTEKSGRIVNGAVGSCLEKSDVMRQLGFWERTRSVGGHALPRTVSPQYTSPSTDHCFIATTLDLPGF